ncbi:hypothetical protein BSLG_001929 [Batrachochytrium salamandrivorans]|nr:hypothetical protein BSLG_001929 [Batrachochytrium salamandrivorans]
MPLVQVDGVRKEVWEKEAGARLRLVELPDLLELTLFPPDPLEPGTDPADPADPENPTQPDIVPDPPAVSPDPLDLPLYTVAVFLLVPYLQTADGSLGVVHVDLSALIHSVHLFKE